MTTQFKRVLICRRCRTLRVYRGSRICAGCMAEMLEDFGS
jgi:hypothetical protein